ncbi:hypothetical protein B0T26DRAFT_731403 [Lasiosphaeria miniovina]|uniref:Secreted protein n=1 Tax=Lasiosphaeria miniovina TaxID=1954250 RepID=A0AA40DKS3_9PEZI|nr:uncharacterized protein B0T26DRAFT_731403 [Lasiosphaeria miniovina]KAK0703458.1 hypothetical protein B0T26DRAFT_731403 [Lasiosphaeria miniovina]
MTCRVIPPACNLFSALSLARASFLGGMSDLFRSDVIVSGLFFFPRVTSHVWRRHGEMPNIRDQRPSVSHMLK